VNREASSSAFAGELMTLAPRAETENIISAPTWRLILPAAIICPFKLDEQLSN
jgi:hypothetical protein